MTTERKMAAATSLLEQLAIGRTESLFAPDVAAHEADLVAGIGGLPVLIVGGAGSIGAATVRAVAPYRPSHLHIVDQDENALAELVRDLRSSGLAERVGDLRALALDYGAPPMQRFLLDAPSYGTVLNFAAIKHVRSEKDLPSILHMLDTNVVKPQRLMEWLAARGFGGAYFAVSTDKAADPVNFMGASKRIQEILTLSSGALARMGVRTVCARFANVAYSNGSLLHGFLRRLEKGQALAVPRRVRRFLISHEEAAHICLLGAVCGPSAHAIVPRDGSLEQVELTSVAAGFLKAHGLETAYCATEVEARRLAARPRSGTYPVLLTDPDTAGEKLSEQFVSEGERPVEFGMQKLVALRPATEGVARAVELVRAIERLIAEPERPASTGQLESLLVSVLPSFHHAVTGRSLDQRM